MNWVYNSVYRFWIGRDGRGGYMVCTIGEGYTACIGVCEVWS